MIAAGSAGSGEWRRVGVPFPPPPASPAPTPPPPPPAPGAADVVWTSASSDVTGSMPLGNGRLGVNVWATTDSTVGLLLSHVDALDENWILSKLGRVLITVVDDGEGHGTWTQPPPPCLALPALLSSRVCQLDAPARLTRTHHHQPARTHAPHTRTRRTTCSIQAPTRAHAGRGAEDVHGIRPNARFTSAGADKKGNVGTHSDTAAAAADDNDDDDPLSGFTIHPGFIGESVAHPKIRDLECPDVQSCPAAAAAACDATAGCTGFGLCPLYKGGKIAELFRAPLAAAVPNVPWTLWQRGSPLPPTPGPPQPPPPVTQPFEMAYRLENQTVLIRLPVPQNITVEVS